MEQTTEQTGESYCQNYDGDEEHMIFLYFAQNCSTSLLLFHPHFSFSFSFWNYQRRYSRSWRAKCASKGMQGAKATRI